MGQIKILDTGYIDTDNSGTQASSGNRANSGSAISLKTMEFVPQLARALAYESELATKTPSSVNRGSLSNMSFTLKCLINKSDTTEMGLIAELLDLVATDGYKLLWYDYADASVEKNTSSLLYQTALNPKFGDQLSSGEATAFGLSTQFYTLHVLFEDVQFKDSPKGTVKFDLKGVVLPIKN